MRSIRCPGCLKLILVLFVMATAWCALASNLDEVAGGAGQADAKAHHDLPLMPRDPDSIKGKIEVKVESGLIDYGPWLLFGLLMASGVGLALGEDIFVIPAGFLMQQGVMPIWGTIAAAYFGVVLADTVWVLMVRLFSRRILRIRLFRRLFHPRRILEIKYRFDRWGAWVVVASRFIPFSRTPVFTAAGLYRMNIWKFFFAEALAAIPVVAVQLGIGWLLAKGFSLSEHEQHVEEALVLGAAILVLLVLIWLWHRRRKLKTRPPRAPVAWLREAIRGPSRHEPEV